MEFNNFMMFNFLLVFFLVFLLIYFYREMKEWENLHDETLKELIELYKDYSELSLENDLLKKHLFDGDSLEGKGA